MNVGQPGNKSTLVLRRVFDALPRRLIKHFVDDEPHPLNGKQYSLFDADSIALKELEMLGAGGYGEVHRVRDPSTGLEYARKAMARPVAYKHHCELLVPLK